jgi:hypothetical protein
VKWINWRQGRPMAVRLRAQTMPQLAVRMLQSRAGPHQPDVQARRKEDEQVASRAWQGRNSNHAAEGAGSLMAQRPWYEHLDITSGLPTYKSLGRENGVQTVCSRSPTTVGHAPITIGPCAPVPIATLWQSCHPRCSLANYVRHSTKQHTHHI